MIASDTFAQTKFAARQFGLCFVVPVLLMQWLSSARLDSPWLIFFLAVALLPTAYHAWYDVQDAVWQWRQARHARRIEAAIAARRPRSPFLTQGY